MQQKTEIITRFAPSPTGFLHIGGARTALFNYLFARKTGGRFKLRIEDTDRERSTTEAVNAILGGMRWLGLEWDGDAVSQHARADRHREVVDTLVASGHAFRCYCTPEEVEKLREQAFAEGRALRSPWRDGGAAPADDRRFTVRFRAGDSDVTLNDAVQGDVRWAAKEFDDLILLRADGNPTYNLAVVVDDHDMGVTHIIRGDDHLVNGGRQAQLYDALGWDRPVFAHIPLIHGPDGKKLSKRHGALGLDEYRRMGFPAEAVRNYLARLGWSHGDEEVFTTGQALEWFDIAGIRKSPARYDLRKLEHVSGAHIARMEDADLVAQCSDWCVANGRPPLTETQMAALEQAMFCLKERAKTLGDLYEKASFILKNRPMLAEPGNTPALDTVSRGILSGLTPHLRNATWTRDALEALVQSFARSEGLKVAAVARPLRVALSGQEVAPSVFDMLMVIGRDEALARIGDVAA